MPVEVYMPKMSDHMKKGTILKWLVEEGAQVEERQPILEIETDKAVGEVEAPTSGILCGIRAGEGAVVPVGEVIAFVAQPGEEVPELPPILAEKEAKAAPTAPVTAPAPAPAVKPGRVLASPVARRAARELGVDLTKVKGTGPGGRIKKADVRAFAELQKAAPAPAPAAIEEEVEWLDLSTIRRITGERMALSKQTVPHFVLTMETDMTEAVRLREKLMDRIVAETGQRLSYTALLVKVVALALKRHPLANAEFVDGRIKLHRAVNVGVAVGVEEGLVVPVIRAADTKSLADITLELKAFQEKASLLHFTPDDLSSGTFTISNLGMFGIDQFSAIINVPQSAILAVGRIVNKPVGLEDESIGLRPMLSLTLSVDHRVLDGVTGAKFLAEVKDLLENPYLLL